MSRHNPEITMRQMLDYSREAIAFSRGLDGKDIEADRILGLALIMLVEMAGEAATSISKPIREQYPQVKWGSIIGMRNHLIHGYDVIEYGVLWDTVHNDMPVLVAALESILPPL